MTLIDQIAKHRAEKIKSKTAVGYSEHYTTKDVLSSEIAEVLKYNYVSIEVDSEMFKNRFKHCWNADVRIRIPYNRH